MRWPPRRAPLPANPLALTDRQLETLKLAASVLDPPKRVVLFQRVAAYLRGGTGRPSDADLSRAVERSLRGLIHSAA